MRDVMDRVERLHQNSNSQKSKQYALSKSLLDDGPLSLPDLGAATRGEYLSLARWQNLAGVKKAADPKDKVFAYHSCFHPDIRRLIDVDYSRELLEILMQVNKILLQETKTFDVLFRSRRCIDAPPTPTWAWIPSIGQPYCPTTLYTTYDPKPKAGGSLPLYYQVFDEDKILHVKGKFMTTVKDIALPMSEDQTYQHQLSFLELSLSLQVNMILKYYLRAWQSFGKPVYDIGVADFNMSVHPYFYASHKEQCIRYLRKQHLPKVMRWLSDQSFKRAYKSAVGMQTTTHHRGRRMFSFTIGGENTLHGVGPVDIQPGDNIFAIHGCSVPIVLRSVGDYEHLIGDAFVMGAWDGNVFGDIEAGNEEASSIYIK
jgi:hypothetical protein